MKRHTHVAIAVALSASWMACSASQPSSFDDQKKSTADGGNGGSSSDSNSASSSGGDVNFAGGATSGGGGKGPGPCKSTDSNDWDKDGVTKADGDCNDCDPNIGPNAIEIPTAEGQEKVDEDCDDLIDEDDVYVSCDEGIAIDESDPLIAAKAVGICKNSTGEKDWGLIDAKWTMADGSAPPASAKYDVGHGVLPNFGPNVMVREGKTLLALSSGAARRPGDVGYQDPGGYDKEIMAQHPQGFPKESPACPGVTTGDPHDAAALELSLRTPANAHGISFNFNFYTYEWPMFVCSTYNDFFVALLSPKPPNQVDENISFDSQNNPVSVNNAFLEVCGCAGSPPGPCMAGGKSFSCNLGNSELIGTGFGFDTAFGEDHGATSWLETQAPVEPNSVIRLRWTVYDSGDGSLDSTTLIDNFRWLTEAANNSQTRPIPR
jgi:hypothetical protein